MSDQTPQQYQYPPQPPPVVAYYPVAQPQTSTDGLAVASLVLGILWLSWLGSVLAVIFGHVALHRINRDATVSGRGLAVAGLVLGYIGVATLAIIIVFAVVGAASNGGS